MLRPATTHTPDDDAQSERFQRAFSALTARLKQDRAILAALLCGSLAHDRVWARSDIDLVLVTIDDKLVPGGSMALDADGVNVHAILMPRARFKRLADGAMTNSFMHSLLSKGRLVYSHDDSLAPLLERMRVIGDRDTQILMLGAATEALSSLYKARKWLITRGDYHYSAVYVLAVASALARIEVMGSGELADREVLPRALAMNPAFFGVVYTGMLNGEKTREVVQTAIDLAEDYLLRCTTQFSQPIIAWLDDAGEARSCTEIDAHFSRTMGVEGVSAACEYLADQGILGRASVSTRLTKKSTADVQELAFYALTPPPTDF